MLKVLLWNLPAKNRQFEFFKGKVSRTRFLLCSTQFSIQFFLAWSRKTTRIDDLRIDRMFISFAGQKNPQKNPEARYQNIDRFW